jgi:hypothetical protein
MSIPAASPLDGTRLLGHSPGLRQDTLAVAMDAWHATDLLGETHLQEPSNALRDRSLEAGNAAWASQNALRNRILTAAEAAWITIPYESTAPIRLLSDEDWVIETKANVRRRRTFVANVALPLVAALLVLGFGIATGGFRGSGENTPPTSISVITEQQPMLGVVARSVKKGGFFSEEPVADDHYDDWLEEEPNDKKRPRKRSNQ